jgi:hypothetical protein
MIQYDAIQQGVSAAPVLQQSSLIPKP